MATRDPVGKKRQGGEYLSATGVVIVALYILGELGVKEPPANVVAAATGILVGLVGLVASWWRDRRHRQLKTTIVASLLLMLILPTGCAVRIASTSLDIAAGDAYSLVHSGPVTHDPESGMTSCEGSECKVIEVRGGNMGAVFGGLLGKVLAVAGGLFGADEPDTVEVNVAPAQPCPLVAAEPLP